MSEQGGIIGNVCPNREAVGGKKWEGGPDPACKELVLTNLQRKKRRKKGAKKGKLTAARKEGNKK